MRIPIKVLHLQKHNLSAMKRTVKPFIFALVLCLTALSGCRQAPELTVMSFNVRLGVADVGENSWPKRREAASAILPQASGVHLVMDRSVCESEWFACTDGTATCFVKIKTSDLLEKYLAGKKLEIIG